MTQSAPNREPHGTKQNGKKTNTFFVCPRITKHVEFSVGHIFCSGFLQMEREAAIFIEGRNVTNVVDHKDEPNVSSGRPVNSDSEQWQSTWKLQCLE